MRHHVEHELEPLSSICLPHLLILEAPLLIKLIWRMNPQKILCSQSQTLFPLVRGNAIACLFLDRLEGAATPILPGDVRVRLVLIPRQPFQSIVVCSTEAEGGCVLHV